MQYYATFHCSCESYRDDSSICQYPKRREGLCINGEKLARGVEVTNSKELSKVAFIKRLKDDIYHLITDFYKGHLSVSISTRLFLLILKDD